MACCIKEFMAGFIVSVSLVRRDDVIEVPLLPIALETQGGQGDKRSRKAATKEVGVQKVQSGVYPICLLVRRSREGKAAHDQREVMEKEKGGRGGHEQR